MNRNHERINAAEAAEIYGCTKARIYQLVSGGHLENLASGDMKMILVDPTEVRRLSRENIPARPRISQPE